MSALDDLLGEIFDGTNPGFYAEFESWVRQSRRFRAFACSYRGKIRSKLKQAHDENTLRDLYAELATAARLLRDERFALEYETHIAARQRGPDFTVSFRINTRFNVEVRRLRSTEDAPADAEAQAHKLLAVLCDKVGQMPPGIVNLLWLVADREIAADSLTIAVNTLRQLAERKDDAFFVRRGFRHAADFLRQYQQLSGIVFCQAGTCAVWLNPLARHRVPPDIVTALRRLESA